MDTRMPAAWGALVWRRSGAATLQDLPAREAAAGRMDLAATSRLARRARIPRLLRWASRIESWPPALWLWLQALALWPVAVWAARRMGDGSDEPLGLVALALLGFAAASGRLDCRRTARTPWLFGAMGFTILATALIGVLPWLALAVLASLAMACAWAALRAERAPLLPVLGLLLLALPVIASLQFYAGYPLRLLTAHASATLLQLAGVAAEASGAAIAIDGRLVIVDAPCSGVQLAWLGYCAACAAALWNGVRDARFAARLPWVGLTVLAGNVLRNTLLVAKEGGALDWPAWTHEAIGLVALAAVCAAVVRLMRREGAAQGSRHAPR